MSNDASHERVAHLVELDKTEALYILGPMVEFLTPPDDTGGAPCIMRGTIPPGGCVPLHSHADPETFIAVSGDVEGLTQTGDGFRWIGIKRGDVFHVPGGAKHAFRNQSLEPAVLIIVTTGRIGRFFREIGTPAASGVLPAGPSSAVAIRRFLETAARYGYWNATPEENAWLGLRLS